MRGCLPIFDTRPKAPIIQTLVFLDGGAKRPQGPGELTFWKSWTGCSCRSAKGPKPPSTLSSGESVYLAVNAHSVLLQLFVAVTVEAATAKASKRPCHSLLVRGYGIFRAPKSHRRHDATFLSFHHAITSPLYYAAFSINCICSFFPRS